MKIVRSISATAIPNVSTSDFNASGTANVPSSTAITNTLSSESAFSIRKPDQYSPAAPPPSSASTTRPNATPTTIHSALQPAARRSEMCRRPGARRQVEREQGDHGRDQRNPTGE